ncbi:hypothetical protein ACMDCR_21350 [Labrys okinawensis]|uniref:hypothetical protein n=1 Tax=Labrys okinawensis TaxID=346911 RepID=UPI0039BD38E4
METREGIFRWAVGQHELACILDGQEQKHVKRERYELLETQPPYDDLPTEESWRAAHRVEPVQ